MIRVPVVLAVLLLAAQDPPRYETREKHDPNGINKWYLGREIAHVMGPGGIPWLDRPEREDEENPTRCIEALKLKADDVVADLGAGSGFYSFRMAAKVGGKGRILAVEIQDEMIAELNKRIAKQKITNVDVIKGTVDDPKLPEAGVDLIIMVDVYHELEFPFEVMTAVKKSLKPGGRVALVEFRKEDRNVPIKDVHKMSEEQIGKEMAAVGLRPLETVGILPWQHIAVYTNRDVDAGIELGFRLAIPEDRKADAWKISTAAETVMRKRLDAAGIAAYTLSLRQGLYALRLPGATPEDSDKAKRLLGRAGRLQFRSAAPLDVQTKYVQDKVVPEGFAAVERGESSVLRGWRI